MSQKLASFRWGEHCDINRGALWEKVGKQDELCPVYLGHCFWDVLTSPLHFTYREGNSDRETRKKTPALGKERLALFFENIASNIVKKCYSQKWMLL